MIADDQHADFAQHQDADHVDDIDVGAEFAEMENALLRDDAPIRNVISRMIGTARQPTRSRWCTIEVRRKPRRTRDQRRANATVSAPKQLTSSDERAADIGRWPRRSHRAHDERGLPRTRRRAGARLTACTSSMSPR